MKLTHLIGQFRPSIKVEDIELRITSIYGGFKRTISYKTWEELDKMQEYVKLIEMDLKVSSLHLSGVKKRDKPIKKDHLFYNNEKTTIITIYVTDK